MNTYTSLIDTPKPIGVFDSGYGGLTVLHDLQTALPHHDFLYLGDNARAPYGTQSFDAIYRNTLESVRYLFAQGCPLVILACNTASARALRTIQQRDLSTIQRFDHQRVLGVIRPTAETIGTYTQSRSIGILATSGTVQSQSYLLEIQKFSPDISVYQQACPRWVDFIEAGTHNAPEALQQIEHDLKQLLDQHSKIDCILLACTHYPLVSHHIRAMLPAHITLLEQGHSVAEKAIDYLQRHPEISSHCSSNNNTTFVTTGSAQDFITHAQSFYEHIESVTSVSLHDIP